MDRREFLSGSLLFSGLSVAGCVTTTPEWTSYSETVTSVLISADEKQLAVVTRDYHYLFEAPPALVRTLKGSFHPDVIATLGGFRVFANGTMQGTVTLQLRNAPADKMDEAVAAGFSLMEPRHAALVVSLEGHRYKAGSFKPLPEYQLNKSYQIAVEAEKSTPHIEATPIKMVAGVPLVLGGVVLFPLAVAVGCVASGNLGNCHE
ncbi:MAG: hypothetical protein JSR66_04990 [Proteobacteria bacterium]|nr:hypothetical protein [Pseudomonadota bacterium]